MTDKPNFDELPDKLTEMLRKQSARDSKSSWYQDEKFIEWIARQARNDIDDGVRVNEFDAEDCVRVAESLRTRALAERCRLKRIIGVPEYHAPELEGSAPQVMQDARRSGFAPCLDLSVAAGIGRELWDEECSSWVKLPSNVPKGNYVALKVSGESMLPLLHSGDVMVVRLDVPFSSGDIVVARLDDDGFVVKRLGRVTTASIELLSINSAYDSIDIRRSRQAIVGTVVTCWCDHEMTFK